MKCRSAVAALAILTLSLSCSKQSTSTIPMPSGSGAKPSSGAESQEKADPVPSGEQVRAQDPVDDEPEVKIDLNQVKIEFGGDPPQERVRIRRKWVALGRKLYHDKRLSKGGDISCATCHDLKNYGQDGKPTSPGTGGAAGKRNTPTVFNSGRQFKQFWDYRADTVEQQATMPILTANEHGIADEAELVAILEGIPEYVEAFKDTFPKDEKPITAKNVGLAIGNFERKLKTRSRWDDFVEGDASALTNQEKRGLNAFKAAGCTTCHKTRLLGGNMAQKVGLVLPVELEDKGRFELTRLEGDTNMFKVPQLLNIEKTGPYMHDGSIETLEESVRYMVKHQLGTPVSDGDVADIVAFLKALTGELEDPSLAEPPPE